MNGAFDIVFEDEHLIVLNKIRKLLVQPSPKREKVTLTSILAAQIKQKVYPCHRLDRETTGLIIYAKQSLIQQGIMWQFHGGEIKKCYLAFVKGKMRKSRGRLEGEVIDTEGARFGEPAKQARANYRVIAAYPHWSLIELIPRTGRTNQLRIQLGAIGHPILGERKYARGRDFTVNFRRLALHASYINFTHPVSRERIGLTVELPQDMKTFLAAHKKISKKL